MATAGLIRLLDRVVCIRADERPAALWSFAYFFCLLCSYYVLRPVREEMGVAGGVERLPWVFTLTFVVMLAVVPVFGALAARYPRRALLPIVYGFFIVNILGLFAWLRSGLGARLGTRCILRVAQRLQPVRGLGLLELHGRSLE